MAITEHIKFFDNQYITASNATVSSEHSSYPFSNAIDNIRSRLYQPNGTNIWYIEFDFGAISPISFFGAIGKIQSPFTVSSVATVTLKANNVPSSWTSPPFSQVITPSEFGMFLHIDNSGGGYRYWRLDVDDSTNPNQNEIGYMYLGDHINVSRTINRGFQRNYVDNSKEFVSNDGTKYFDEYQKYISFSGLRLAYLDNADFNRLEAFVYKVGVHTPFFVSLDPLLRFSIYDHEYTKLCVFPKTPNFSNIFNDVFTMSFDLDEVI
jgi:hypothetical protein